jgi:hypothetical protein
MMLNSTAKSALAFVASFALVVVPLAGRTGDLQNPATGVARLLPAPATEHLSDVPQRALLAAALSCRGVDG